MAMMESKMSLTEARAIADVISRGIKKFGTQFNAPYRNSDILRAIITLQQEGPWGATPSSEEVEADDAEACRQAVSAANRRAGAAEARLARCIKKQPLNDSAGYME